MNAHKAAYPINPRSLADFTQSSLENGEDIAEIIDVIRDCGGLTKREKIATMAMQGILANSNDHFRDALIDDAKEHEEGHLPNSVAMNAIAYADALLEKLEATDGHPNRELATEESR